jgi:ABC-type Fe3+/spermidine/putrescine transport system ATPase subunit
MADEPLWTLDRVSLGQTRLREVSLEIRRGVTAILGWSGAGKTSLLNVLVGFEKPERGILAGPRAVAWAPQDGGLWPHCTVREHLAIVQAADDEIEATLEAFDLADRAAAKPEALSAGERARLTVARALLMRTDALVLDEPLAHVDPARVEKYWKVVRDHLAANGASLVFATHEPERVLGEARRVVCLHEGAVRHAGEVAALYADPPTPELMSALGPGNWLSPAEAELWLDAPDDRARCFRPEQLAIEPAHISPIVVCTAQFRGAIAEVELHHLGGAVRRRFFHRPSGSLLREGEPATIALRE